MIRIHIFHTGAVRVDRAIPYKEKNPLAVTGWLRPADKKVVLPVSSYLIEHPRGRLLLDTGWDSRYVQERPYRFFGLLDGISTPILQQGESIDQRLAALGMTPADIDWVVFSHMDFDHTSGLRLVREAGHILASAEEIRDSKAYFFRYVKSNWDFAEVEPFAFADSGIGPVGKSWDVFGDGSLLLVNTPGHTHGHCSAVVRGEMGYVLLAGDAAYTQRSIREGVIPGFTVDRRRAAASLAWIRGCAADPDCLLAAPNHDPSMKEQILDL